MEKTLGKEYADPIKRRSFLKDNCDCVVEKGYMKAFAPEKVQELKEKLAETSIEIGEIETEKKAATTHFNAQLKPLLEEKSEILRGIKERARERKRYPGIERAIKRSIQRLIDEHDYFGNFNATADEIFDWWLSDENPTTYFGTLRNQQKLDL